MIFNTPFSWRKGLVLSATFFCGLLIAVSCRKKNFPIGESTIDQSELLASGAIDTFTLRTFSYNPDSIITSNPLFGLLGSYNDPEFGPFSSEIYTQISLSGLDPDFGNLADIVVDSLVLAMEYVSSYGSSGNQTVEVYELDERINTDSTYYAFSAPAIKTNFGLNNGDLVRPGYGNVRMDVDKLTVVGDDTLSSNQLRIQLHTSIGKRFLIDAASGNGYFSDNESFFDYFKGLRIKVNNGSQSPGQGGIFYFKMTDPDTKVILYYRENGEPKSFDFLINSTCAIFNHVETSNPAQITNTFENPAAGNSSFYAQAFTSRAVIQIPGLSNIPKNAVIHKAVLELPVSYHYSSAYNPGDNATVTTILEEGSETLYSVGSASYSDYSKSFTSNIRDYVQAVVNGELNNTRLIISPSLFNTTATRIIFNGAQSTNKKQPKLYILYSEF